MKGSRVLILLAVSSVSVIFPMGVSAQTRQPPPTAVPGYYAGLDKDTAVMRRGESTFYQRCSFCHLPRIRKEGTTPGPGPNLSGILKGADKQREATVRDFILKGSDRMPGWQYSFKPAQMDELISYLKTL